MFAIDIRVGQRIGEMSEWVVVGAGVVGGCLEGGEDGLGEAVCAGRVGHDDGRGCGGWHFLPYPSHPTNPTNDVSQYFPDSESVNRTLRSLIALIPQPQLE